MGLVKNTAVSVVCVLVMAGCASQQKKRVTPVADTSQTAQSYPYPGNDVRADNLAGEKDVLEPYEITFPGDERNDKNPIQGPLPTINYINDRIFEYGRKLDRWKEVDRQSASLNLSQEDTEKMVNCFVDLQKVLGGYNQLRADMLQLNTSSSSIIISSEEVLDLQKTDVTFLESICGRLLAPEESERVDWENREEGADLSQLETLIERYTGSREYEEVVQVWQKIPEQQIERVHLRTKILYGNSLMFLHQEEKAAEIYQQIVEEMSASDEQRTDLLSLRKVLADLYTAAGNYPAAENQYLNISQDYKNLGNIEEWSKLQLDILERSAEGGPELTEFSGLLRNFLGFIPERDGFKIVWQADKFLQNFPYSAVASNVDIIRNVARSKSEKWFNSFFVNVDQLVGEKKYLDAIEKLEAIPEDIISAEQMEKIKTKNDDLILAEAVERETRKIEKIQELQRRWNEGMLRVEEGNYDEAIAIFRTLLQTEYFAKAEDKIDAITLLAAKTDRRAAADMYIRYNKTSDIEMKRKLLIESRRLLSDILTKYPEVSIVDKVKGNIERVEAEMDALDPMLLPGLKAGELDDQQMSVDEKDDDDFAFSQQDGELPIESPRATEDELTN